MARHSAVLGPRTDRLTLVVGHDGEIGLTVCNECSADLDEIAHILATVQENLGTFRVEEPPMT